MLNKSPARCEDAVCAPPSSIAAMRPCFPRFETVDYLARTPFLAVAMVLRFPPKRGQPYGPKRAVLHVLFPPLRGKHGRIERLRKGVRINVRTR